MRRPLKVALPRASTLLISAIAFLTLCSISAFQNYKTALVQGANVTYAEKWLNFIPWWGHWIWIAPLLITRIQHLPYVGLSRLEMLWQHIYMFVVFMGIYWGLTLATVSLYYTGNIEYDTLIYFAGIIVNGPFHFDVMIYISVVCLGLVQLFDKHVMSEQARNKALSHQLLEAQLESLRSQLNPHFLFNTLNSICSLIRQQDLDNALKALSELSLMLRKVLENRHIQTVTVEQELTFTKSYLSIQKLRFGDKIDDKITVDEACNELEIPFMLLQPLLENAVQHSSQLTTDSNPVHLDIRFMSPYLHVTLINRCADVNEHNGFGIGIKNCRQRLEQIYGNDFELSLEDDASLFTTKIKLPAGD